MHILTAPILGGGIKDTSFSGRLQTKDLPQQRARHITSSFSARRPSVPPDRSRICMSSLMADWSPENEGGGRVKNPQGSGLFSPNHGAEPCQQSAPLHRHVQQPHPGTKPWGAEDGGEEAKAKALPSSILSGADWQFHLFLSFLKFNNYCIFFPLSCRFFIDQSPYRGRTEGKGKRVT